MDDGRPAAGPGDRDIGEAAFLLEAGEAAFVDRALRREHAFFPARQIDGVEFEALGGVDGHDGDAVALARLVVVHDQADMFEERLERFIFLHRAGQLGEVFEAAGGLGRAVGLEHRGVAEFFEDDARELGVGRNPPPRLWRTVPLPTVRGREEPSPPAGDIGDEIAEAAAGLRGQFVAVEQGRGGHQQRLLGGAGVAVDGRDRFVAEAALGGVDDAFEGKVVGGLGDQAEVSDGVADLGALVEAEAADDLVIEADGDEPLLELAGLELGADEDRDVVERLAVRLWRSASSPTRRASSGPSQTPITRTVSPSPASVHKLLPRRPALCAIRPSAAERMWLVER